MVCLWVGLSVTIVSPAKTGEPIEIGSWTWVSPGKHVLDGVPVQIPHAKGQL